MNRVGTILRKKREEQGLSSAQICEKIRIQQVYLDAIEQGDFAFFKGQEFYQQIFVKAYAQYFNLNINEALALLDEDRQDFLSGNISIPTFMNVGNDKAQNSRVLQTEKVSDLAGESSKSDFDPETLSISEVLNSDSASVIPNVKTSSHDALLDDINNLLNDLDESEEPEVETYFETKTKSSQAPSIQVNDSDLNAFRQLDQFESPQLNNYEPAVIEDNTQGQNDNLEKSPTADDLSTRLAQLEDMSLPDYNSSNVNDSANNKSNEFEEENNNEETQMLNSLIFSQISDINTNEELIRSNAKVEPIERNVNPIKKETLDQPLYINDNDSDSKQQAIELMTSLHLEEDFKDTIEKTQPTIQMNNNPFDNVNNTSSIDQKVARALGDSSEMDAKELKKMKSRNNTARILDILIIVIIIALLAAIGWYILQMV